MLLYPLVLECFEDIIPADTSFQSDTAVDCHSSPERWQCLAATLPGSTRLLYANLDI